MDDAISPFIAQMRRHIAAINSGIKNYVRDASKVIPSIYFLRTYNKYEEAITPSDISGFLFQNIIFPAQLSTIPSNEQESACS